MKEVIGSGPTVDEAKQEAFKQLGVKSEKDVEIEIIDEGSKGVWGFGTKFARVKVRLLKEPETEKIETPKPETKEKPAPKRVEKPAPKRIEKPRKTEKTEKKSDNEDSDEKGSAKFGRERAEMPPITVGERPLPVVTAATVEKKEKPREKTREKIIEPKEKEIEEDFEEYEEEEEFEEVFDVDEEYSDEEIELLEEEEGGDFNPREITRKVLELMEVNGEIKLKKGANGPIYSIEGEDLGVLIGKHGQTLESIQFIVNLILLRKTNRKKKITLDVEGYRSRRQKSLQELARRLADKVKKEKRKVVLEPMLPSERRIIHMALQNNPHVSTFSQGEEPMRKVIISPKKRRPAPARS